MSVPLVQQMPEVRNHVPCNSFEFIWVHFIGVQPLQVQDVLLTVSQLINMTEFLSVFFVLAKSRFVNLCPKISGTS